MRLLVCVLAAVVTFAGASTAQAASGALYGIQDDAWLEHGPGTLESRLDELDRLGVDVVRYTVRWDLIAKQRPTGARDHTDVAYDWRTADSMLRGLRRHGIRPVITLFGLYLPVVFSGTVFIETIFGWPGMGKTIIDAITTRDYPLVMATSLIFALLVVAGNLIADVLYAIVDPRIRYD